MHIPGLGWPWLALAGLGCSGLRTPVFSLDLAGYMSTYNVHFLLLVIETILVHI